MSFKYQVTVEATFTSKTEIEPKVLKVAKKELVANFPQNAVRDAGLDEFQVLCGKATVTIE